MLIGLTGHAGAGKDSAGQVLAAARWQTIAFADALRIEVASTWGIDVSLLHRRELKERPSSVLCVGNANSPNFIRWAAVQGISLIEPRSPRWVLQQWGTFRRDTDRLYWVRHVQGWLRQQLMRPPYCVAVTDVRYPNEAQALRDMGGLIVRVHRPGHMPLAADTAQHSSEQHAALQADADIHNTGGLDDLSAEVWRVVHALQQRVAQATNSQGA